MSDLGAHPAGDGWPGGIGLIGSGAMGRAMLAGLLRGVRARVVVSDAVAEAAEAGAAECGGAVGTVEQAAACELVVLAVKPKDAAGALEQAAAALSPDAVLLSVVAGWDLPRLRSAVPRGGIARTMPNLAVRMGMGTVAIATDGVGGDRMSRLVSVLQATGTVVPLPESLFAAATAVGGSGPGLLALVAEAMEDGGVAAGLTRDQARAMVRGTMAGTAALLGDIGDPSQLRQRVSSPAGTTVAGLAELERGAVRAHVIDAVVAAARRAAEL